MKFTFFWIGVLKQSFRWLAIVPFWIGIVWLCDLTGAGFMLRDPDSARIGPNWPELARIGLNVGRRGCNDLD